MKYILLFLLSALALLTSCSAQEFPPFDEEAWRLKVEATDPELYFASHVDEEGLFFNPWLGREERNFSLFRAVRYRMADMEEVEEFDSNRWSKLDNDYAYLMRESGNSISFAGHASFFIKLDGQTIVTDPFFSGRALILGTEVDNSFDWSKLGLEPVVLISHNHYDHLDEYSVKQLIKKRATFIVPLKLKEFFLDLGAEPGRVHELDWWEEVTLGGITYTFLPAQHWSRRLWQPAGSTLWGGFLIRGSKQIYFSGDTGYFKGFRIIGERYPGTDYALIAAGAYLPRSMMHYAHQNVDEFFRAVDDLGAKVGIPLHFGVINLGKEPIHYPLHEIDKRLEAEPEYRRRIRPLRVGEYLLMD